MPEPLNRRELITHILRDLENLKKSSSFENKYALEENITFFEAIKSFPTYIKWLFTKAPKLQREKLLELTDFPFPHWDREMHLKLIEVEKKNFPSLVAPLVNKIYELIIKSRNRFIGVSLGCGGMEVERQVIKKLLNIKHNQQVVLIGVDKSTVTHEIAKDNLREIEPYIDIHEVEHLNNLILEKILKDETNYHVVIICKNDIFELAKDFRSKEFDLIYHSLFKHHLNGEHKQAIDLIIGELAKKIVEYDGFKNLFAFIPQTIIGWRYPFFLNAEIFSNLRYFQRWELKTTYRDLNIKFFNALGTYLVERP